jgi:hypothetical protein
MVSTTGILRADKVSKNPFAGSRGLSIVHGEGTFRLVWPSVPVQALGLGPVVFFGREASVLTFDRYCIGFVYDLTTTDRDAERVLPTLG